MKSLRIMLSVVLMSLTTVAFAQSDAQKSANKPAPSDAQKTFTQLKNLAVPGKGRNSCPAAARVGGRDVHAYLAARNVQGNALVHEMQEAGTPLDPTRYDIRSRCSMWMAIACC